MIASDSGCRRLVRSLGVAAALALATPPARANDPVAAQALFDEAKKLIAAGSYAPACLKLEESQRLDPGIGTLFHLADCHQRIGKTASAWAEFLEVAAQAKTSQQTEREKVARERASALESKLPRVVVNVGHAAPGLEIKR